MYSTRTARAHRWLVLLLASALYCLTLDAAAQGSGPRIAAKLERAGVLDNYFPEVVFEVASSLAQALPGAWRGVQVNQAHRADWLNIYLVDARRLPEGGLLDAEGVPDFTEANLRGGARADPVSGTVFLNTAMSKRLVAATVLTQTKQQPDLTAALASIDAVGVDAAGRLWDVAALSADTPVNRRVGWLMRGTLAFVLAHEMGHLRIDGPRAEGRAAALPKQPLTERQKDERRACPELIDAGSRALQQQEQAADQAGVALLGAQCRIGDDGQQRHAIYMLGTTWYFLASMSDKLIEMGRHTDSPVIAQALRSKLGPQLYEQVVAAHAAEKRRGAVAQAFPSSHPPDSERMRSIEAGLRATPCGSGGLDSSGAQLLEMFRLQMCRRLVGAEPSR